ncbi:predicted protein [Histoplasma capsulatum G186AR]|uniref:Uncharacterized protein n=1 Tax=Ajellomyces capsulatus (strain G186AR / H82 / ATCC MYA-2454 / RMSCC 2432) TaxID=447093 RepID=C0P009_AJECG|nr:uncharacterized protein HCBG_08739 [Histoplasma capsulatum G186AR]EEH03099.1 predicted protein [Histoplasma capsulatum G186AR]
MPLFAQIQGTMPCRNPDKISLGLRISHRPLRPSAVWILAKALGRSRQDQSCLVLSKLDGAQGVGSGFCTRRWRNWETMRVHGSLRFIKRSLTALLTKILY